MDGAHRPGCGYRRQSDVQASAEAGPRVEALADGCQARRRLRVPAPGIVGSELFVDDENPGHPSSVCGARMKPPGLPPLYAAPMALELVTSNEERARVGRWRERDELGVIAPVPGDPPLSREFVDDCLTRLSASGFETAVTPALSPTELSPFLQAGFVPREGLHVLTHDLQNLRRPTAIPGIALRRWRPVDVPGVMRVDAVAFDDFWRLDLHALREARSATPHTRFRVAVADGRIVGYCITGRSRLQGYLQRLAVGPEVQGRGLGRHLVDDALAWLAARRARACVVNTQESNERALALYRLCGFTEASANLLVLATPLRAGQAGRSSA